MSEIPVAYLLKSEQERATLEPDQSPAELPSDWAQFERMLIPMLNYVRKVQGKKPVYVPKG